MLAIFTTVIIVGFAAKAIRPVSPAALAIAAPPNVMSVLRLFTAVSGCLAVREGSVVCPLEMRAAPC